LEQSIVLKGGFSCLISSSGKCIQWANLVMDFLLMKMLKVESIDRIYCICLDRRPNDILCMNNCDKLKIVSESDPTVNFKELLSFWKKIILTENNYEKNTQEESKIAIVLYSLSELVSRYAVGNTVLMLNEVKSWSGIKCLVTNMHASLHSSHVRCRVEQLFSTLAFVNPNNGMFSDEVIVEIQTIRRSNVSGKVTESSELFGCQSLSHKAMMSLYCIHRNKVYSSIMVMNANDIDADNAQLKNASDATGDSSTSNKIDNISTNNPVTSTGKRLVTFDSMDPEFDEDSDPDADLDL
jgi:hypothetical protein